MNQTELKEKYKDIEDFINYYWNNIREELISMEYPMLNISRVGYFEINKELVFIRIKILIEKCKKAKTEGNLISYSNYLKKIKILRKILHKSHVINYIKNFELNK